MPVRQLRRLDVPAGERLYDRLSALTFNYAWTREEIDLIPPELVVERDGSLLAAFDEGEAKLAYGFASPAAFVNDFPPMLDDLLPRMRKALRVDTVRFRLDLNSVRPTVEPVLRRAFFSPSSFWLRFSLDRARLPKVEAPKGVKFRDGGPGDIDEVVRLDREAFPNTPLPVPVTRRLLDEGERVLFATVKDEIVGMAQYTPTASSGGGYLRVLAVGEGHRGRGIGAALTARVAKQAFAAGAQCLDLRTDEDNANAIRLYVRLGFRQTSAGRDYVRPTDPRAIEQLRSGGTGTLIRFGGWR